MKFLSAVFCVLLLAASAFADVPSHLQKNSVTVRGDQSSGSGAIIVRNIEGTRVAFVWTAYHVIDGNREVKAVLKDGGERKVVTYRDVTIVQELLYDGATVGDSRLFCKVLATSPRNDIALLQVRQPDYYDGGVEFVLDDSVTQVATELFHCGSPGGQEVGHNSLTTGIIAANGRIFDGLVYDQTTVAALPGSSGGIVARQEDGLYVGMLTLGLRGSDNFNYIVPARRIVKWCIDNDLRWAVDPSAPAPTFESLLKLPIEDTLRSDKAAREREPEQGLDYVPVVEKF